jgi:hypothetical protein
MPSPNKSRTPSLIALTALVLLASSLVVYALNYTVFHDVRYIVQYLLSEIGFIPIQIIIVTLILERIMDSRERKQKMLKLNMVIGAFFSETGSRLISRFAAMDSRGTAAGVLFQDGTGWSPVELRQKLSFQPGEIRFDTVSLTGLKSFLHAERTFLLSLLENPNLLEHDGFTDMLWAVFHLTEELLLRKDISDVSGKDADHIRGDITRAYGQIVREWVLYMDHIRVNYPYLFSLAVRMNPFNPSARAEIS